MYFCSAHLEFTITNLTALAAYQNEAEYFFCSKLIIHSVQEQIQEIWHDTVSMLVWLQSRGKTITENQKK